ncbi:13389_t:CDS:1 [Funneliformis geosporum]|uniref:Importin subunit alpha n=1 Tax=Funneliformis geosporum TaxID=1117311 RepID=A0A9W4SMH9_9GLOM|nr:1116_t:CDS:1 [Funneliformis geosporum]CAI2181165.1 13389_t:CDS:1 [Funneliformis geosporum]
MNSMQIQRKKSFKANRVFDVDLLFQNRQKQNIEIRRQLRDVIISKHRNLSPLNEKSIPQIEINEPKLIIRNLKIENFSDMVQGVYSNNLERQLISMRKFRKLLAEERVPPIQQIIDAGVIPKFVEFLQSNHKRLKIESSWALKNILAGSIDHIKVVVNAGALPIFVQLLQNDNSTDEIREHAIWAIGNISSDETFCDLVFRSGALKCLLYVLNQLEDDNSLILTLARTICNLCRVKISETEWWSWMTPVLVALSRMIHLNDDDILYSTCLALSYLSDGEFDRIQRIQTIINTGMCPRLVELMVHKNINVQIPVLKCLKNISAGSDSQVKIILNCGVLNLLKNLFVSKIHNMIRKEACSIVSTIASGAAHRIQAILDAGMIPFLIDLTRNSDFLTKKEATWAICSAIRISYHQSYLIRQIINSGCIQSMIDMLDCKEIEIIFAVLEAIQTILRFGESAKTPNNQENEYSLFIDEIGGKEKIYELQYHKKYEIYNIAFNIIDKYFGEYEENTLEIGFNFSEEPGGSNDFMVHHNSSTGFQFLHQPIIPFGAFHFNAVGEFGSPGLILQSDQNGFRLPVETSQNPDAYYFPFC